MMGGIRCLQLNSIELEVEEEKEEEKREDEARILDVGKIELKVY